MDRRVETSDNQESVITVATAVNKAALYDSTSWCIYVYYEWDVFPGVHSGLWP